MRLVNAVNGEALSSFSRKRSEEDRNQQNRRFTPVEFCSSQLPHRGFVSAGGKRTKNATSTSWTFSLPVLSQNILQLFAVPV